jgi:uncharacterized membrane protein
MKIRNEFAEEVVLKKSRIKQKSKLKGIVDCNILEISIGAIITVIIALILHALKVI